VVPVVQDRNWPAARFAAPLPGNHDHCRLRDLAQPIRAVEAATPIRAVEAATDPLLRRGMRGAAESAWRRGEICRTGELVQINDTRHLPA
jgi:hypothetical protein